jgi:hypothetical protein
VLGDGLSILLRLPIRPIRQGYAPHPNPLPEGEGMRLLSLQGTLVPPLGVRGAFGPGRERPDRSPGEGVLSQYPIPSTQHPGLSSSRPLSRARRPRWRGRELRQSGDN